MALPLTSTTSSRSNRFPISSARSHTLPSICPVRSRSCRVRYGFPALLVNSALFATRNRSRTGSPSLRSFTKRVFCIGNPAFYLGIGFEDAEGGGDPVHGAGEDPPHPPPEPEQPDAEILLHRTREDAAQGVRDDARGKEAARGRGEIVSAEEGEQVRCRHAVSAATAPERPALDLLLEGDPREGAGIDPSPLPG